MYKRQEILQMVSLKQAMQIQVAMERVVQMQVRVILVQVFLEMGSLENTIKVLYLIHL